MGGGGGGEGETLADIGAELSLLNHVENPGGHCAESLRFARIVKQHRSREAERLLGLSLRIER